MGSSKRETDVQALVDRYGQLDILQNNPGIVRANAVVADMLEQDWSVILHTKLRSCLP